MTPTCRNINRPVKVLKINTRQDKEDLNKLVLNCEFQKNDNFDNANFRNFDAEEEKSFEFQDI